jgi:two-component system chemotaxis response regulator CheY
MATNILIVDDSSLTRKKIRRIIEMAGHDVEHFIEAGNGCEALNILDESNVDLVLADLNMPEMSGAEMIRRMKSDELTRSIPVVVVSTESRTSRIKGLLADGVKDYLHKPFTPEEFKELIHRLWDKSPEETGDLLIHALTQALETMAFLTIVPNDDDMATPDKTILAEMEFTGPKRGTICILAGVGLCRILAENIAGLDNVDDEGSLDALKELANVTCGLFLPMVVSSTADLFDVTVPTVKTCSDSTAWDEFIADRNCSILNVEGHATAVRLTIEGE